MRKLLAVCTLALVAGQALAADIKLERSCVSSGGGFASGGAYRLTATVGQAAAGFASSPSRLHWIGFWAGEMPIPTPVADVGALKQMPDGAFVSVAGKVATSGATDFGGFFYVEESNRSSGVRVVAPAWPVAGLQRGSVVNVIGTLGTSAAGERAITASLVIVTTNGPQVAPLAMTGTGLGGGDLGTPPDGAYGVAGGVGANNIGLLVKVYGRVRYGTGGVLLVEDGSGVRVRIDASRLAYAPTEGTYVAVTGISSLEKPADERLRLVLPRDGQDLKPYTE